MTNEEKAKEIAKKYQTPCHGMGDCEFEAYQSALEAMEWKEQILIDKACEWLKENKEHPLIGCEDTGLSGFLTEEFIAEFRKAMEGGEV